MSGWLLDTNVISELRRPRPETRVVAFVAAQPLEQLFVSTVTFAEIRYGIEMVDDAIRRAELFVEHLRQVNYPRCRWCPITAGKVKETVRVHAQRSRRTTWTPWLHHAKPNLTTSLPRLPTAM